MVLTSLIMVAVVVGLAVLRQHSRSLARLRRELLTMRRVLAAMPEYQAAVDRELERIAATLPTPADRARFWNGIFHVAVAGMSKGSGEQPTTSRPPFPVELSDEWKRDHGIPIR